jgi:DeoR/GlpR family transcriptional regulator of sugar metabolism
MNQHHTAIVDYLTEQGPTSFSALFDALEMPAETLYQALWRLRKAGRIRAVAGGCYKAVNTEHGRRVRDGIFVSRIPRMGDKV